MTFPVYQGDPWMTSKDVSRSKGVNIFLHSEPSFLLDAAEPLQICAVHFAGEKNEIMTRCIIFNDKTVNLPYPFLNFLLL